MNDSGHDEAASCALASKQGASVPAPRLATLPVAPAPLTRLSAERATRGYLISLAIAEARRGVACGDGGPFGAVIVRRRGRREPEQRPTEGAAAEYVEFVPAAHNGVLGTPDPTAHAEVQCIRAAAATLQRWDLSDCEMYASCYACPMCYGALVWAKIGVCYFAASSEDAARVGFDDAYLYEYMRGATSKVKCAMRHVSHEAAGVPFGEYAKAVRDGQSELF